MKVPPHACLRPHASLDPEAALLLACRPLLLLLLLVEAALIMCSRANRTSCLCYSLDQSNKQHRGRGDIRWTCTLARLQMGLPQRPEVRRPQEQNQSPTPKAARGGGAWVVIASGRARAVVDDTASTSCWHNSSCLKFVDDSVERMSLV
mgnify:CR=1 FL=1